MTGVEALEIVAGGGDGIAAAAIAVAVYYVRAGLRSQREALATLDQVRATYAALARSLYGERASRFLDGDDPPPRPPVV